MIFSCEKGGYLHVGEIEVALSDLQPSQYDQISFFKFWKLYWRSPESGDLWCKSRQSLLSSLLLSSLDLSDTRVYEP